MGAKQRLYADVEYLGRVYLDAEFHSGEWWFENFDGVLIPFLQRDRVKPVNEPQHRRRHPAHQSGEFGPVRPPAAEGKDSYR